MLSSQDLARIQAELRGMPDFDLTREVTRGHTEWRLTHLPTGQERGITDYDQFRAFVAGIQHPDCVAPTPDTVGYGLNHFADCPLRDKYRTRKPPALEHPFDHPPTTTITEAA